MYMYCGVYCNFSKLCVVSITMDVDCFQCCIFNSTVIPPSRTARYRLAKDLDVGPRYT